MDLDARLRASDIQPTAQRVAIARYALSTHDHPSADDVFTRVKGTIAVLSRATVYNTLKLFVERGLLREHILAEGKVVFDPNLEPHHHFIDDDSGRIEDIPWTALEVKNLDRLSDVDIREYQVVLRGRLRRRRRG